jgi:hypothetical protein
MGMQNKESNKLSILNFRDMPIKVKVGFWVTFISTIFDKLLEVLPMKGIVLPPVALDILFYGLLVFLAFGLVMLALGLIEWTRKTWSQKQMIENQSDNITKLERDIEILRREYTETIKPEILKKLKATGRLEDVSQEDSLWIVARGIEMQASHGYNDVMGLFADRASGVPLNELMTKPCSDCGVPRNQRGKHHE